jgi:transcription elongation factor
MQAAQSAVEKMFDPCMGDPLKTTMQDCVKTKGFNVVCQDTGSDCAFAAPGGNTLTLTPNAYKVASCDALNSSSLHEMVHACGNFKHRKCDNAGNPIGEVSCTGQAGGCKVCVDPNTDKSYGCEAACYGAAGSSVGKAAACK